MVSRLSLPLQALPPSAVAVAAEAEAGVEAQLRKHLALGFAGFGLRGSRFRIFGFRCAAYYPLNAK